MAMEARTCDNCSTMQPGKRDELKNETVWGKDSNRTEGGREIEVTLLSQGPTRSSSDPNLNHVLSDTVDGTVRCKYSCTVIPVSRPIKTRAQVVNKPPISGSCTGGALIKTKGTHFPGYFARIYLANERACSRSGFFVSSHSSSE